MQSGNWMQELFEELKRRRVIRVATLYVIAFWPIIQIVDILSPTLNLPDSVIRYLVFAFIGGFPVMLILAWVFDINRDGISVTPQEGEPSAVFNKEPSAALNKEPSAVFNKEPSAALNGKPSAALSREPSAVIGGTWELRVVAALILLVIGLFVVQSQMDEVSLNLASVPAENTRVVDSHSIAVLPFASFSEEIKDQLFADGLTEELLTVLSRVKELRVTARTSSFAYRGVNKNVIEIGKELDVAVILEGSVRRNDVDDTIRVTAQLIETKRGRHLWTETYDRQYTDIFKIQDDIAAAVVRELQITLLGDDRKKIQSRSSASPEAMVAYGMGQSELSRRTKVSLKDAERYFKRAISEDPQYSDAYAGLATAYALLVNYGFAPDEQYLMMSQEAIDHSLSLDPDSGLAWAVQGLVHMEKRGFNQALRALEKAMVLNPSNAMAPMWYASLMKTEAEQLRWYEKAYELDPKSPVVGFNVARIMLKQQRDVEAMQVFTKIVESDPYYPGAYFLVAQINEQRGRLDEAIQQYERAYELQANISYSSSIAELYIDVGEFEKSKEWLEIISDDVSEPFRNRLDWLRIRSFRAQDKFEEARPFLVRKIAAVEDNESSLEANLDAALAAYFLGGYENKAIAAFEKAEVLRGREDEPMGLDQDTYLTVALYLNAALGTAYAYRSIGDEESKLQLLATINDRLKDILSKGTQVRSETWYQMALLSAMEGNEQMALVNLQRAIDEGWRQPWRPQVEPIMKDLILGKNFRSMLAGLETRMSIMREQLTLAASFETDWPG